MSAHAHRAVSTLRALRGVALRVVLTSGVLGAWFAVWWMLRHGHPGVL